MAVSGQFPSWDQPDRIANGHGSLPPHYAWREAGAASCFRLSTPLLEVFLSPLHLEVSFGSLAEAQRFQSPKSECEYSRSGREPLLSGPRYRRRESHL